MSDYRTAKNAQLQQSADRCRAAFERAEQQLDRIQTPEQRAAARRRFGLRVRAVSWPWRRFIWGNEAWHWFPQGRYKNASCGHAGVSVAYFSPAYESAESPDGKSNVCPDCLEQWKARNSDPG